MLTSVEVTGPHIGFDPLVMSRLTANSDPIHFREIQGLGPVKADISSTPFAITDGDWVSGKKVSKRNIVMTVGFNPDWVNDTIASLRNKLYAYFMPKQWVNLKFYSTHLPDVFIEGYVESCEPNMFSQDPEVQISIICPKPHFTATDSTILTGTVHSAFGTPLVINNPGTVASGFVLEMETPSADFQGYFTIRNDGEGQSDIQVQSFLTATRKFVLSTLPGEKFIREINPSSGALIRNLLDSLQAPMYWQRLDPGETSFEIKAVPNDFYSLSGQTWELTYNAQFGGL